MAKLALWLTFTLMALQGSSGASLKSSRNQIDDQVDELLKVQNELTGIISFIADNITPLVGKFDSALTIISLQENGNEIFHNLKETIQKIEEETPEDFRHCNDANFEIIMTTTEEYKGGVASCTYHGYMVTAELQGIEYNLNEKVLGLKTRVINGMHECLEMGEDIDEDKVKCLKDLFEVLKQETIDLEKEVEDGHKKALELTENGVVVLKSCLRKVREDLSLKSETILGNLKQCIQGSPGASSKSTRNQIDDLHEELLKIQNEVTGIISFIDDKINPIAGKFESDLIIISQQGSGYELINNLRESIKNIEEETSENARNCIDDARKTTMTAIGDIKKGSASCSYEGYMVIRKIQEITYDLNEKASNIKGTIITGTDECLKTGEGTDDINVKCLKDLIEVLQQELADLEKKVEEGHKKALELDENGVNDLRSCFGKINKEFSLKSETILENLKQCIQNHSIVKIGFGGISDFIKELKENINSIIHVIANLPTSIPEKIHEIISRLNIGLISKQLESEINTIINNGDKDAEDCRPEADQRLDQIVKSAEEASKLCLETAHSKNVEIKKEIASLLEDTKILFADFSKLIFECGKDNMFNSKGFAKCLELHYDEYEKRIEDVQKKIRDTEEHANDILQEVAQCVNNIQIDTVEQGQVLIEDVEKCVRTNNAL